MLYTHRHGFFLDGGLREPLGVIDRLALLRCVLMAIPQLKKEKWLVRFSGYVAMMHLYMFEQETFSTAAAAE